MARRASSVVFGAILCLCYSCWWGFLSPVTCLGASEISPPVSFVEGTDPDALLADKDMTFPAQVPVSPHPRETRPFLGFDYYASVSDVIIAERIPVSDFAQALSIAIEAKLKEFLRHTFPSTFTTAISDQTSFLPLIHKQILKSHSYIALAEDRFDDQAVTTEALLWTRDEYLAHVLHTRISITIFILTDLAYQYFDFLRTFETTRFSLITFANYDFCVPYIYEPRNEVHNKHLIQAVDLLLEQPQFRFWFSKNVCVLHPKLIALPLGPKWQFFSQISFAEDISVMQHLYERYCRTPFSYFKNFTNVLEFEAQNRSASFRMSEFARQQTQKEIVGLSGFASRPVKDRLLYVLFDVRTTDDPHMIAYTDLRMELRHFLLARNVTFAETLSPKRYLAELARHQFALCPPGKGLDTHRLWEALSVGTIPIVLRSPLDHVLQGLPVLLVDDLAAAAADEHFLREQYQLFHSRQDFTFDKVYSHHWDTVFQSLQSDEREARVLLATL